jgi:hypothetical protein
VQGAKERIRLAGKRVARKADPAEVLRIEAPDWRRVDDETWLAIQAQHPTRGRETYAAGRGSKSPLAGIAKCAHCGGGIGVWNTKAAAGRVRAYSCSWHRKRGNVVCR